MNQTDNPTPEPQVTLDETMSYVVAYDTLNQVAEKLNKLDGRDLDQVLPLLEKAEKAHAVIRGRIEAILSSPLLAERSRSDATEAPKH